MATMNTADIGFEREIWKAADKMRGNIDASEYKSVVLGLIFLKYISDKFETKIPAACRRGRRIRGGQGRIYGRKYLLCPDRSPLGADCGRGAHARNRPGDRQCDAGDREGE